MTKRWLTWESLVLAMLVAVLILHVWFPRIAPDALNDTYSVEVGGRNVMYQLAERRLPFVERNQRPLPLLLTRLDPDATLCSLGPARYPSSQEWSAILDWVSFGGTVLFATRWDHPELSIDALNLKIEPTSKVSLLGTLRQSRLKDRKKNRDSDSPDAERKADEMAERTGEAPPSKSVETTLVDSAAVSWKSRGKAVTTDSRAMTVLISDENGPQAVRVAYGAGQVVIVASDFVFSNESMAERDRQNGVLAFRLLESAGECNHVVFDESLNATGTPKVVGLILDAALRPITLQVLVVFIVFAWRGNRRFGGLLPRASSSRHDIADHTNALGNLYFKIGDPAVVLRSYLEQVRIEWHLRFVSGGKGTRNLEPLARRLRTPADELRQLLADAEAASQQRDLRRRDAARLIRQLAALRINRR
jgi:hypothetical protein